MANKCPGRLICKISYQGRLRDEQIKDTTLHSDISLSLPMPNTSTPTVITPKIVRPWESPTKLSSNNMALTSGRKRDAVFKYTCQKCKQILPSSLELTTDKQVIFYPHRCSQQNFDVTSDSAEQSLEIIDLTSDECDDNSTKVHKEKDNENMNTSMFFWKKSLILRTSCKEGETKSEEKDSYSFPIYSPISEAETLDINAEEEEINSGNQLKTLNNNTQELVKNNFTNNNKDKILQEESSKQVVSSNNICESHDDGPCTIINIRSLQLDSNEYNEFIDNSKPANTNQWLTEIKTEAAVTSSFSVRSQTEDNNNIDIESFIGEEIESCSSSPTGKSIASVDTLVKSVYDSHIFINTCLQRPIDDFETETITKKNITRKPTEPVVKRRANNCLSRKNLTCKKKIKEAFQKTYIKTCKKSNTISKTPQIVLKRQSRRLRNTEMETTMISNKVIKKPQQQKLLLKIKPLRPRKVSCKSTANSDSKSSTTSTIQVRKRGRPKKSETNAINTHLKYFLRSSKKK